MSGAVRLIFILTNILPSANCFLYNPRSRFASTSLNTFITQKNPSNNNNNGIHTKAISLTNNKSKHVTTLSTNNIQTLLGRSSSIEEEEIILYGEKYEMIELPDSMVSTTIFIGNLDEFVTDEILSSLFQQVTTLNYIPAFIVRKLDGTSLRYGFVTYPTTNDKEFAIKKFNGYLLNDKVLKVEAINRSVRVPGKLVNYVVGKLKQTLNGKVNTLRRSSSNGDDKNKVSSRGNNKSKNKPRKSTKRKQNYKLNEEEQSAYMRAKKYGFLTLDGTGYRRGRRNNSLCNIHRQYCDYKSKPQIVLCKASSGRTLDNIIIDLSTLRLSDLVCSNNNKESICNSFKEYYDQIMIIAQKSNIIINTSIEEDNTITLFDVTNDSDDNVIVNNVIDTTPTSSSLFDTEMLSADNESIEELPCISIGVFEGERHNAKIMVKELAKIWDTCDDTVTFKKSVISNKSLMKKKSGGNRSNYTDNTKGRGKSKMKTLSRHRS